MLGAKNGYDHVDVLVVGGGPTGLVLTGMLVRAGHKVLAVEQYEKHRQALYGRACMLWAGSLEILDLLDVYEQIADFAFVVKKTMTFKDGARVSDGFRGWTFVETSMGKSDTMFKHSFSLRQKHLEDALRAAIDKCDSAAIRAPAKLVNYRAVDNPEYPVLATVQEGTETRDIYCKYLVGADGGRSMVRKIGDFHFTGTASPHRWVRLDAIVETNMPSSRSHIISIQSKEHGNVLWCPTDNGRTRIGFVYTQHGTRITNEVIMESAKAALQPFSLEFVRLDWWTVYEIGQRIADTFQKGRVFLAGDAAHTHSSGAAQGMNVGIHDAMNLGWKLAGVLSGLYTAAILDTYNSERHKIAEHVMKFDQDIASLISGTIPAHFNAPPEADPNDYLDALHWQNALFTTGIGVWYEANLINQTMTPQSDVQQEDSRSSTSAIPNVEIGRRAPDGPVFRSGRALAQSLRTLVRYTGRFWALLFVGPLEPTHEGDDEEVHLQPSCRARLRAFLAAVHSESGHTPPAVCDFLTILRGHAALPLPPAETLGAVPLGKVLFDHSAEVYPAYGVDASGIVVLRPDGVVGFATSLDARGAQELSGYFQSLAGPEVPNLIGPGAHDLAAREGYTGYEFDVEGEEAEAHLVTRVKAL